MKPERKPQDKSAEDDFEALLERNKQAYLERANKEANEVIDELTLKFSTDPRECARTLYAWGITPRHLVSGEPEDWTEAWPGDGNEVTAENEAGSDLLMLYEACHAIKEIARKTLPDQAKSDEMCRDIERLVDTIGSQLDKPESATAGAHSPAHV